MRRMRLLLMLLAVAACTVTPPPTPVAQADTCRAGDYAALVSQPATALERVLLLGKVRVIRPNQAVTMDFWPDRINFMIDDTETIAAITCG